VRFIFGAHKDTIQKRLEEQKAKADAARHKLQSAALLAKMGAVLGKKKAVVLVPQEELDDAARALAACKSAKARADVAEGLAARLEAGSDGDGVMKITVASVCSLFGLLKYDHEKEKMVVLLARHIADPENKVPPHPMCSNRFSVQYLTRSLGGVSIVC